MSDSVKHSSNELGATLIEYVILAGLFVVILVGFSSIINSKTSQLNSSQSGPLINAFPEDFYSAPT